MLAVAAEDALKLVEDGVVLVQVGEARANVFMHVQCHDRLALAVDIPQLHCHVVAANKVAPVAAELHIRDGGDHLREERARGAGVALLEEHVVLVTERLGTHVHQADGALAAAVREEVAVVRVELRARDHLGQFLHVGWLDVHDVEAALGGQVPQVYSEIIRREVRLVVAVHGDGVDIVGVGVGVDAPAARGKLAVRADEPREGEDALATGAGREAVSGRAAIYGASASSADGLSATIRVVRLLHDAAHLPLEHLPELHCLVVGGEQKLRAVAAVHPPDLVDLLLDVQGLEVVELRLVALKLRDVAIELLAARHRHIAARRRGAVYLHVLRTVVPALLAAVGGVTLSEEHDAAAAVAGGQVTAVPGELDGGDYVGVLHLLRGVLALPKDLEEVPVDDLRPARHVPVPSPVRHVVIVAAV
mmetsp:Transcript_4104/g.14695  ORF Transcript_4104/g.14695 Transcript_4104/m.14695 type:complete len:419 (+) Transcript_4104:662-1918(+)